MFSSLAYGDAAYYDGEPAQAKRYKKKAREREKDHLCQYFPQDLTMDVGEPPIDPVVADG